MPFGNNYCIVIGKAVKKTPDVLQFIFIRKTSKSNEFQLFQVKFLLLD